MLSELKPKWDSMTDAQRTALGDTLAGTNQYKVLAAVLQNFEHATDATKVALNSAGSAAQENAKYLESLEAREQSLKAEFEDFANRVLSKDVVAGFYNAAEAALKFVNTDFGAATTRIIGTTTAVTSLVGIVGTMGAKLALVGKQLQAFGAADGILGLLTTPKTLLIVAGVAAAIGLIAEGVRYFSEIDTRKLEKLNNQLQETNDKISEMSDVGSEYDTLIQKADELTDADKKRLEVLEAQLENLKQQKAEQEEAYYLEWQRQQTTMKGETVVVQPDINDPQGFEHTEIIEYSEAQRTYEALKTATDDLTKSRYDGNIAQKEYLAGLQNLIDGNKDYYDNLKSMQAVYEATGNESLRLSQSQSAFISLYELLIGRVDGLAGAMSGLTTETNNLANANNNIDITVLVDKLALEAYQSGVTGQALADLVAQEIIFNNTGLDVSQQLEALQQLAVKAGYTATAIASISGNTGATADEQIDAMLKDARLSGERLTREQAEQRFLSQQWQSAIDINKVETNTEAAWNSVSNTVTSGAGSTAKKVEKTAKDSIDNISDYAEKAAQAAQQKIEDAFNKLREAEEKYWDDKIDALEKQNEQIDRQVQLEEKLKALQEAKQKKILLYKDGRFQYSEDIAAVEGAQYDYDQTYRDIANEEQKEILNDLKEKALALIDEYKEKALEQGTLTQGDIKSLLDEYHNLGNQTYNTVAYGVENMTNLISAGMKGMIAAASGNITDVSGLLNSAFGSGLSSILGGAGSGLGGTGYLDKWSSSWAEGTADSVLYGGAKDYLASPAEPGYLQRSKNYAAAVSDYYTNAKNYGADVAWWIQAMSDDSFRKNYFSQSKDDLLNTDWAKFAETAKDWNEFQESMARGIAKIKYLNLDVNIDKWISDLFTATRANKDSFMYQEGYSKDELVASALRESGVSNRSQLGFIQAKYLADTLNPENEEDLYKFINYRLNSGVGYGNMAQMREVTKEMINRDDRTRENMLSMYKDMLIDFQNAVDHFSDSAEMTDEEFEAFRLAISGTPIWDNFYYQGNYDLQKQALTSSRDAVIKKMAENSLAWQSADPTERARLAAENQKLGAAIGATYTDGKWDFGEDVSEIVSQAKANADSLEKANKENNDSLENTIKESITDVIDQIKKNTDRMLATDDEDEKMILEAENEKLAGSIGVDYDDGGLDEESVRDAIKDKMRENARAWHNASDEEKARLHAENEQLGASIGAKYDNGIWHYASGTRSAHGGLSLVGEDGPEMRVLGKGDGVIPSDITNTLWKFGQNPKLFMRSLGESVSNVFNIDNLQLPNVKDPASFISGLKEFAYQYVTAR